MPAERPVDGRPLDRAVGREVLEADQAAVLRAMVGDQARGLAGVELVGAAGRDPLESAGQVGLHEPVALPPGRAVWLAIRPDGRRERGHAVARIAEVFRHVRRIHGLRVEELGVQTPGERRRDDESVACQADGRPDEVGPPRTTEPAVRQGKPSDRPRHPGGPRARAMPGQRLAVGSEIHPRTRGAGRGLAEVEGEDLLRRRPIGDDEPAAPEVARGRMSDREREGRRHGGVNRVAARAEDVAAGVGRISLLGYHDVATELVGTRAANIGRDAEDPRDESAGPRSSGGSRRHPSASPIRSYSGRKW